MALPDGVRRTLEGAAIVLVGNFNPTIFQPAWFAAKSLIRDGEAEAATDVVITNQLTEFKAEWLHLQVTQERFSATTADASSFPALRDLVLSVFGLLEHTPFHQMGINHFGHYEMPSEEKWHAFGDHLTPKGPWEPVFAGRTGPGRPGMRSVTIEWPRRGSVSGFVRVKVEPSVKVTPGVYFQVNEHYQLDQSPTSASVLLSELKTSWDSALAFSEHAELTLLEQDY